MNPPPTAKWKSLGADGWASSNQLTLRLFMDEVVDPALATLETQIVALSKSAGAGDAFRCIEMREILRATVMAFCLSIQSIWERQIRFYLAQSIGELGSSYPPHGVQEGKWEGHFTKLRIIRPETFKCYAELWTMEILANVCRHGDGRSATELWKKNKEFWPATSPLPSVPGFPPMTPPDPTKALSSAAIVIPPRRLRSFAAAIVDFWEEIRYFSMEAIKDKHPSLIAELEVMRTERAKSS